MKSMGTEFKVGLFTIVALFTTSYMFFVLSPDSFETSNNSVYYTILDDAAGVIPKTHVKTNGVTVGKVKSVELKTNRTRIEMEVDSKVKIPKGSKVEIRSRGLLGDKFIEIIRVKDTGEYITDGGFIPISDDQVDIAQLTSLIGSIAKDVKQVSSAFSLALGGDNGEKTVSSIVSDLHDIVRATKEIVEENRQDVRLVMQNLQKTTATLKEVLGDNKADLNYIVKNIKGSTDDLKLFAESARELVTGDNRDKLDRIIASFDQTMSDVEKTAKNVALVSDKIEKGEGTIGRLINDDSVISELQGAITDIRKVMRPATQLQVEVDYHGEFKQDNSAQHYFNLLFKTRPDKYYLLGVTDMKEDVEERQIVNNDTDPNDNIESRTITSSKEKRLRINAQFAKRWHFAQVRFGLFESTGGFATDVYAFSDRFRLTAEAFDWDNDFSTRRTAHIKAYLTILFFNHVYAIVGVDDPTRKITDAADGTVGQGQAFQNYFVGAGLSFKDDDLKAMFGTAALAL
jgi:phospholipid/cholesterol/gamma-HCH transport system substrate-binding protein